MDSKKGKTILIIVAVVVVLAFVGVSAFRYFTVVAPSQGATQEEVAEESQGGEQQDNSDVNQASDTHEEPVSNDASGNQNQNTVTYEGEAARLFSILDNFNWINTSGEYLDFNSDGTVGKGTQRSSFNSSEFTIRSVEGTVDDPAGCEAVVTSGEQYAILRFVQNMPDTVSYFADFPDSDYRIDCSLFGDTPFYKVMTDGVVVDGYEYGAPDEVLAHQTEIDEKIAALVANEVPAVSKATWNKEASFGYSETGRTIIMMYTCNNPSGTVVTVTYSPDTGDIQLFAGNDQNAFVEDKVEVSSEPGVAYVPQDTGQMDIPPATEEAQKSWDEAAKQAAEQAAAQDSNEGGNQ